MLALEVPLYLSVGGENLRVRFSFVSQHKSISSLVSDEDLPEFVVLVGPNGAGKSHLFEAIHNGATEIDDIKSTRHGNQSEVKLYELGQLVPNSGGEQNPIQFKDVWGRIKPAALAVAQQFGYPHTDSLRQQASNYVQQLSQNINIPGHVIEGAQEAAGKLLPYFTDKDYRDHFPLYQSTGDLFQYSLTDIFLTYFEKWDGNKYQKFLNLNEGMVSAEWLEDSMFIERYGRAPWVILDEVLASMGLTYQFVEPVNLPPDVPYQPRLIASDTGTTVSLDTLSSGEKVLLALALGLYAGKHMTDSVRKPRLLLLDEADASLHPSMIRSLLSVTQDVLCDEHHVKVILATHSPTTVALAPEASIYALARSGNPRLAKVTRERALAQLTVGIPTLSVRVEDRRQVFVESEKDVKYYDQLYKVLKPRISASYTLQFIASGSGGAGSCDAVVQLVGSLRGKGNHSIFGVIDRDAERRPRSPDYVEYMKERYAIENYLLDPLLLGAYLLRSRIRTSEQLGLQVSKRYFEITEDDYQVVIDAVHADLWGANLQREEVQTVKYAGGGSGAILRKCCDTRGHDLESLVVQTYPQLNAHRDLLLEVCRTVAPDLPDLIPADLVELFERLASDGE